jgi:hypothetical protein
MLRTILKWLLDKGLIFGTILINSFSISTTLVVIVVYLLTQDWMHRNLP